MTTALDRAHAEMAADEEDEGSRRAFFATLAASELFLALKEPANGENLRPLILETGDGTMALAFDTEVRLGAFLPQGTAYAAISGRQLAAMLAQADVGLGLNLEVAPSAILLPASAMQWLVDNLGESHAAEAAAPDRIAPPGKIPDHLLHALDQRLALLSGVASKAWLAQINGALSVAIADVPDAMHPAISSAMAEAFALSQVKDPAPGIAFVAGRGAMADLLDRHGVRIDLPDPPVPASRDPTKPPRLI